MLPGRPGLCCWVVVKRWSLSVTGISYSRVTSRVSNRNSSSSKSPAAPQSLVGKISGLWVKKTSFFTKFSRKQNTHHPSKQVFWRFLFSLTRGCSSSVFLGKMFSFTEFVKSLIRLNHLTTIGRTVEHPQKKNERSYSSEGVQRGSNE